MAFVSVCGINDLLIAQYHSENLTDLLACVLNRF